MGENYKRIFLNFKHQNIKKMQIAEVKMTYKTKVKASERAKISSSQKAYELFKPFFEEDMEYKELFYAMYLNRANKVIGIARISEGGCSGTVADGKIIFQGALLSNAQAIIIAHNHPSGNLTPSDADIRLTKKMVQFGEYIDLSIIEHVILTDEGYYSFADNGRI